MGGEAQALSNRAATGSTSWRMAGTQHKERFEYKHATPWKNAV